MSRHAFRAHVGEARPPSAWVLVTVASATLWITQELSPWVVGFQIACLAFSYARRLDPHPWQSSPIALNVVMFVVTSSTITVALQGAPAPLALAHFAALSQGLQLLDSRPRKSEFLLVTLALFQVVLAANLTDTVLFPPLLVVFLVSATWTLLVHTLRTEAIEAGNATAVREALTPGLVRMTALASALSVLLALVLFVALPRMRASILKSGLGSSVAVAGFSDRVELGTIGRIRQDHTVVLRVATLEGEAPAPAAAYWRGLAFDTFDGRHWSIAPISRGRARAYLSGSPRFGIDVELEPASEPLVQRIVREPVEAGVIFSPGAVRRVEGALDRVELDANGGLYSSGQIEERVRYTVWTEARSADEDALRRDRAVLPRPHLGHVSADRYLELPHFDAAVRTLAEEIAGGLETDAERARALEAHLRRVGRYTDTPPVMSGDGSPVEAFLLGELAGHCEYFASAMVVLARSLGLPARLVNGFAGGRENELGGFVEFTRSDAHAWVEVHYDKAGWVRYDPTPPDLRLRDTAISLGERLAQLGSAVELWWFQRVVDFDSSDQIRALRAAWTAWQGLDLFARSREAEPKARRPTWLRDVAAWRTAVLAATAAGLVVLLAARARARHRAPQLPDFYRRALKLLARKGLARGSGTTARAFAEEVAAALCPEAGAAFARLTESYLGQRFGGRVPGSLDRELEALRVAVRLT